MHEALIQNKSITTKSSLSCLLLFWLPRIDYKHFDGNGSSPYGSTTAICMFAGRNRNRSLCPESRTTKRDHCGPSREQLLQSKDCRKLEVNFATSASLGPPAFKRGSPLDLQSGLQSFAIGILPPCMWGSGLLVRK